MPGAPLSLVAGHRLFLTPVLVGDTPYGDGEPRLAPLGQTVLQAARSTSPGTEARGGLGGEQAQRPPAVGDDLEAGVELTEASLQVLQGQRECPGDVAGHVLLGGADVEHDHLTRAGTLEQLGARHPLGVTRARTDGAQDLLHLRQARPPEVTERAHEAADLLARGSVVDTGPLPAGLDQAGLAHHLQVRGGRRELEARGRGERLHAALGLAEQLEQFDALGVHDHLADPRQLFVELHTVARRCVMIHRSMDNREIGVDTSRQGARGPVQRA